MRKIEVIHCKYTEEEVLAEYFEEDKDNEYGGWLHLHNEDIEHDREDVEHFKKTGEILKRDSDENIIQ